jgi:lysozyme
MREQLRAMLIRDEALRLKPYRCTAGKLTIGVGRNLDDRGISRAEALMLLENDIEATLDELERAFPWFRALTPARQAVVASMAFNMGGPVFRTFKKMHAALARGDYERAASEMKASKWAEDVGKRDDELVAIMRSGEFPA